MRASRLVDCTGRKPSLLLFLVLFPARVSTISHAMYPDISSAVLELPLLPFPNYTCESLFVPIKYASRLVRFISPDVLLPDPRLTSTVFLHVRPVFYDTWMVLVCRLSPGRYLDLCPSTLFSVLLASAPSYKPLLVGAMHLVYCNGSDVFNVCTIPINDYIR